MKTNNIYQYMNSLNQKDLGGNHLWIRNNDCLTISRGRMGVAVIDRIEGEWTKEEINAALHSYETTEAARR